jgi:hypothetical protein
MISPALQTVYADLVQQVLNREAKAGSVYTQKKDGVSYLYARRTVGAGRIDSFIGPSTDPDAIAKADAIRREQKLARERRKIVSALKRAGVPAPNMALAGVLDSMSDAGLFETGVLVGTAAYQCYSPLIGVALPSASLMTQDADFATAKLAIAAEGGKASMLDILQRTDPSFRPLPGLKPKAPPSSFRSASGFRVDLLTPILRRSDSNPMPLPKLAAGATPLQYLNWLIAEPVAAVALAGSGIFVRVPSPARFAVHKLIVAQRRRPDERLKRHKDLLQASALFDALKSTDPPALDSALRSARGKGRDGWGIPIERSLAEVIRISIKAHKNP